MPIISQTIHYDKLCKIAVIGQKNVGLSNIISRYTANEFNLESSSLRNISDASKTQMHQVENTIVKASVYAKYTDSPNSVIDKFTLRGINSFILVFDMTKINTFSELDNTIKLIKAFDSKAKIVLFGNKSDLNRQRQVSSSEAHVFAELNECPYFEGSALEMVNIVEAFEAVIQLTFSLKAHKREAVEAYKAIAPHRSSFETPLQQFFDEHEAIRKKENSRFKRTYCMFRTSEVKSHWTFTEIVRHVFHDNKHQNSRSKKALMNLGWINENNQVLEPAPQDLKDAAVSLLMIRPS